MHIRPQVGVVTRIVAVHKVVEGMRRMFEISEWPVTATLAGITQSLFNGPAIVWSAMQVHVEQRQA
ncbi:hypothetical protein D3C75_1256380 [compost metagenome]